MSYPEKKMGIIGGAGASAGALLFEKVIEISQSKYGCKIDKEFPHIILLSYPFSDMLTHKKDNALIEKELSECLTCLEHNRVTLAAIACNTLHAFLKNTPQSIHFIHMIDETKKKLLENNWETPLVLCTSTSAEAKLHSQFFSCRYADKDLQRKIDDFVDRITLGDNLEKISRELSMHLSNEPVILGCTELSLLNEKAPLQVQKICDPNEITANALCKNYFSSALL